MASHQTPPHQNHRDWVPGLRWVGTELARRRLFFETHASHTNGNVPCPACGYPTLGRRGNYDCCSLCHWEDDGHDEPCEDQPNGGPNDSSLSQARVNFASTYSAWSWAERDDFSKSNQQRIFSMVAQREKAALCQLYDQLLELSEVAQISQQWARIKQQWQRVP